MARRRFGAEPLMGDVTTRIGAIQADLGKVALASSTTMRTHRVVEDAAGHKEERTGDRGPLWGGTRDTGEIWR